MTDKSSKIPYLRFGEAELPIVGPAVEIIGNARALLQLRRQVDRALRDDNSWRPLDEGIYHDEDGEEYQVVVRRAKSRKEMRPAVSTVEKAPEGAPWAELALERESVDRLLTPKEQGREAFGYFPDSLSTRSGNRLSMRLAVRLRL